MLDKARQTARDAERIAMKHLETAWRQAEPVRSGLMLIRNFDTWEAAHERAERAIANADAIRLAADLLAEVLELVDRRTGRILDYTTAKWYLDEIIAHLRRIDSDLVEALAGRIQRQADRARLPRATGRVGTSLAGCGYRSLPRGRTGRDARPGGGPS